MKKVRTFFFGVLIVALSPICWAADDGFGISSRLPGEHFEIDYKDGVDLDSLISQLHVSSTDQILTSHTIENSTTPKRLASMVEVLFNRASDVLDMHVYSLKGHIKVFATHEQLESFYYNLYHQKLPCTGLSFYLADFDSIYVSAANFRREILGHEMGHALITHYFAVQPSMRIQEVLAGYVEYQLRKSK